MFLLIVLFIYLTSGHCLMISDDVFTALVQKLSLLDDKVQNQENMNNKQEELIRYLTDQNRNLLNRLNAQDAIIQKLERKATLNDKRRFVLDSEGPVAFSAVIDPTVIDHTKANTPIKFETILTEYGGGYNNDTGIFVAPNTGLYLLTCSLLDHMSTGGHGGIMVHGEIMRNHDVLARVFAHAENMYRDQGANTVIANVTYLNNMALNEIVYGYDTVLY